MGPCTAGDAYTKRFDDAIIDLPRKYKCIDDTLLYDTGVEEAFWHVYEFLEVCAKAGMTLKPEKFRFCQREVDFVGYHLDWDTYRPTEEHLTAIKDFRMPEKPSITNVLVVWLCKLIGAFPGYCSTHVPLQRSAKEANMDWCKDGIGFVVMQQYCSCPKATAPLCCKGGWRLALCGSRHLTPAETGYAPMEGEALAVAWCLHKARLFFWGKHNAAANFLSRYPVAKCTPDEMDEDQDVDITAVISAATVAALDLSGCATIDEEMVLQVALEDPTYQSLVSRVSSGDWRPHKSQEPACLRPFYGVWDRLAVSRGLVTYTYGLGYVQLVILEALRQRVAASLHTSHQGVDSMLRRARQAVYWPGMEGDLQYHRATCNSCNISVPSQPPEPLILTPPPDYLFQQTVADLLQLGGQTYLVYADRLTGWLEVAHLPSGASSGKIMKHLRDIFSRWGAPKRLSTDGAEAAVKTAKQILRDNTGPSGSLDNDKVSLALLQYFNTLLRKGNISPAQLTTGRQLRDGVPTAKQNYRVNQEWQQTLEQREIQMAQRHKEIRWQSAGQHRRRRHLLPGARVWVQDHTTKAWSKSGTVVEVHPYRQYAVRMDGSGRISLRTRGHLKEPPSPGGVPEVQSPTPTTESIRSGSRPWNRGRFRWPNVTKR
ncbi:uncharacterized protein LOC123504872 [Portunus trituberculatus]|uniref:uncharacterized protein LOC123504872 n=1 Tax=Portunus trituberculatus TaxID=210409 RepID=UPI001E1D1137|nr:uncharacterized protein LOC123504872 [Portunus trituberculatus]